MPAQRGARGGGGQRNTQPSSDTVEATKAFDNLYFVGMTEYSSWAVNTSGGIILIDAIYDYSIEDEVANGLPKVGLDANKIKYVIVSHGHIDHAGGAKFLQDRFGAHVIMGAADWDLLERTGGAWPKPKRDMVATDGADVRDRNVSTAVSSIVRWTTSLGSMPPHRPSWFAPARSSPA